ncbi:Fc.00g058750.m01.CDS01 [Cosmosporella sp. VM-42]
MAPSNHDATAAEKKRLRDRVAQQNLRNKRNRHIQALELQVKLCRERHGSQDNEHLIKTITELRAENAVLWERQHRLLALFKSCEGVLGQPTGLEKNGGTELTQPLNNFISQEAEASGTRQQLLNPEPCRAPGPRTEYVQPTLAASAIAQSHELTGGNTREDPCDTSNPPSPHGDTGETNCDSNSPRTHSTMDSHMPEAESLDKLPLDSTHDVTSPYHLVSPEIEDSVEHSTQFLDLWFWEALDPLVETSIEQLPAWSLIPLRISSNFHLQHSPWDADIRLILDAPDIPTPLDLLFGSKQNLLASLIHRNVKKWYHGDPERLAIGWLVYHYIKWRTQPSVERYSRLPNCLKPALEQTSSPHPGCLDLIVWKNLRLNMLKSHSKYDIDNFIHLYCSCLKLRWARDEDVLVPSEEDKFIVRPDFYQCFMSEDGWCLRAEFVSQYPELFEGLDLRNIIYSTS